jgi:hypothetical protein
MPGALMQLAAYGAQDAYLTTKPEVTFFRAIHKRHTNFAMEAMEQTLSGDASFGATSLTCRISRNGDALGPVYVRTSLPSLAADTSSNGYCGRVGFRLLKEVDFRVGGQTIDKHYSNWMHVWTELTHSYDQKRLLDELVGHTDTDLVREDASQADGTAAVTLNIPLLFSFCRNPGLALPLIALQYHEVELRFQLASANECMADGSITTSITLGSTSVWCDYYFFDAEERKEFAAQPHEYLIETLQQEVHTLTAGATNNVRLTINHPTKMLVWSARGSTNNGDAFCDFTDGADGQVITQARLKLNGQERFATRDGTYFNYVQPYQHTGCYPARGVQMYSFALKPAEHQPSGTCNMSRIDNINLELTTAAGVGSTTLEVNALSYNVFRVASGMGGNAFAN